MKVLITSVIIIFLGYYLSAQRFDSYQEKISFDPSKRENSKNLNLNFSKNPELIAISLKWQTASVINTPNFIITYSSDGVHWSEKITMNPDSHIDSDGSWGTCLPVYLPENAKIINLTSLDYSRPIEVTLNIFATYEQGPTSKNEDLQLTNCFCDTLKYRSRSQWDCPDPPRTYSYTDVSHLIVHHAAGSNTSSNWAAVVLSIWNFHVNTNGWADVGYNWLIDPNGVLYEGRGGGNNVIGAHFCGKNSRTMGVCMLGNLSTAEPTEAAMATLRKLLFWKSCDSNVNPVNQSIHSGSLINNISGHRDGCATECPGNNMYPKLNELRLLVKASLEACATTSLDNYENFDNGFFPNPANNELTFKETPTWVKIFDYSGKLSMYTSYIEKQKLDISMLQSGNYLIQIMDKNEKIKTSKLLIGN